MDTTALPNSAQPKPRRRWHQYSLQTLLIGIAVLSLPMDWLGMKVREARQQAAAVAAIQRLFGSVTYDYELDSRLAFLPNAVPPGPRWLHELLGDDFFRHVFSVDLSGIPSVNDSGLKCLKAFTKLKGLNLGLTRVTDAGLENLKGLRQLEVLQLGQTHVTDRGLENLKELNKLRDLSLYEDQVTDAGLEHLKGLTQLEHLYVSNTQVTAAGAARLQKALPKCRIVFWVIR